MRTLFLTITFLPTIIFGDFLRENDFWKCLKLSDFVQADQIYTNIGEFEALDHEEFIRCQMLCIALRSREGNLDIARWEIDRLMEEVKRIRR